MSNPHTVVSRVKPRRSPSRTVKASSFPRDLGMVLRSAARGRATLSLRLKPRHLQYQGIAHGGLLTALADTAATFACNSALKPGQDSVTVELKMNFLAPARSGEISARARLLHRGRRTAVAQVEVIDTSKRMICVGTFTMLIVGEVTR